jgi:hypothetical protein
MKKVLEIGAKALDRARDYPRSYCGGFQNRRLFEAIKTYCMFIGYPRSGHSFVGALLDAHSEMIVAHELDTLKYIYARFSKWQIYYLLLERSRLYAEERQKRGGYVYEVPSPWKGRFEKLRVIGDKHGESTTLRLLSNPGLLQCLRNTIDNDIKFIHVIRNPYDNISTISKRTKRDGRSLNLKASIEYYFSLCETVAYAKRQIEGHDLFELRHESFIDSPKTYLRKLCHFLGVEASNDYLDDCASIVFKSPHKSRYDTQWSRELIDTVKYKIDKFPFLQGYSYEDECVGLDKTDLAGSHTDPGRGADRGAPTTPSCHGTIHSERQWG